MDTRGDSGGGDELVEELEHWLSGPLGGHVADALDGDEVEAVVLLDVARHLGVGVPGLPLLDQGEVQLLDPLLGAVGGHGGVGVARVVQHLDAAAPQHLVDPEGALDLQVVVLEDEVAALLEGLDLARDVQLAPHVGVVEEGGDLVAEDGLAVLHEGVVLQPGGVLGGGVPALERALGAVDGDGGEAVGRGGDQGLLGLGGLVGRAGVAVEVVDVEAVDEGVHLVHEAVAVVAARAGLDVVVVVVAAGVVELLVEGGGDELEVVERVGEAGLGVEVPVGGAVADHEALEVVAGERGVQLLLEVVLVDLPGQVGHVEAGVALPRQVDLVREQVGELLEEELEGLEVVHGGGEVVVALVGVGLAHGVAHAGGRLEVNHVGLGVPGEGVLLELGLEVVDDPGPVLLHEAEHGGAAGAAIEPEDEGVGGGRVLGLDQEVVEGLAVAHVQVARVRVGGHHVLVAGLEAGELVFGGLGGGEAEEEEGQNNVEDL
eukprot:CAMPEP_0168613268 /NCGR_PEP_ID=MMETSP0449_2-20121227/3361_1 /TAXON_ID=1082188 /ORGANISM="Strombidium rassoulzadegani, Strain ras09" /LENGTH=487 /DNA_ID=CAMNT_0008653891 /DNA_START=43 /DNA_END=1506 /DNA_ORIENTATION=+